ncbi:unnamed protein product [Clonostachys chloroleuca]|uniref:Xylanolytic transcriptional activator regulatory domain-containing protein n=1 Tax=Clonostachys chloroleuca TaxID=1926264 RepID=A0AA35VV57_9HYPO|nr:unnamed protein product [Clonostachys chloroleuca]
MAVQLAEFCSYLNQLEAEIQTLRRNRHSNKEDAVDAEGSPIPPSCSPVLNSLERDVTADQTATGEIPPSTAAGTDPVPIEHIDTYATKPLHVRYTSENESSARYSYVGDAACEAFNTRVRRHLRNDDSITAPKHDRYFKTNTFRKLADRDLDLPDQAYAMLLIETAERFVGNEYHMFLRKTFLHQFDQVYKPGTSKDPVWLCGLFAILALGELYSNIPMCTHHSQADIPGIGFFLRALDLFEDLYEEPTVSYIETVLLLSYYSHALNRSNSAYIFTGLAVRLSMTLGLHRELPAQLASPFEHEHRRRVWWTVYAFDRLCSLKLGHPTMIRDEDISVNLPSHNNLSSDELEDLPNPKQILSSISMARIAGSILQDLYQPRSRFAILPNVQKILAQLKDFIQSLPDELSLTKIASTACPGRALASLHVHCNHCIVLTTRPVFFQHFQSQATLPHTLAYLQQPRATNYCDASAIILAMSHSLKPTNSSRTLLEGSSSMLRIMGTSGNISARGYYEQLAELKHDLELCKDAAGEVNASESQARSSPIQADRENATELRLKEPTGIASATAITEPDHAHMPYNIDVAAILNAPDINEFLTFDSLDGLGIQDPCSQPLWWSSHNAE